MNSKKLWIALGAVLAGGAAAFYFFSAAPAPAPSATQRAANGGNRPLPVLAASARRGEIDVTIAAIGTVTARNTVLIKARVDGQLQRVAFQEGQTVKAGDVVAELDARPYQALFEQAKGQLARDQALLANAQLDVERYRDLLAKDSIAKQLVDAQEALVRQYQGTVQTDRGTLDTARLQLDFTRIVAPVSGRLGLRQVDVGNMVHASDSTGIFVLTQTQPIAVVFAIPADQLAAVLPHVQAGEKLRVEAFDRDGKRLLATGKLVSVDNQVDTTTGTVKLKAEFDNADNALFPNQFVNARLRVETRHDAILVPISAVARGAQGSFVYVVNAKDLTVSTRRVTLGTSSAESVAIEQGLAAGEQVVIDGTDKLRDGAKVELASTAAGPSAAKQAGAGGRGQRPAGGAAGAAVAATATSGE